MPLYLTDTCVEKRGNTVGLRLLCPQKDLLARLATGWCLGTWIWRGLPLIPEGRVPLCQHCISNVVYTEQLLSFSESRTFVCAKQWVPMLPAPNKNTEHWVFSELSWWTFHERCPKSLLEEISTSVWLHWERILEACAWFSPDITLSTLPPLCI